jgi:hypothetical protein
MEQKGEDAPICALLGNHTLRLYNINILTYEESDFNCIFTYHIDWM